MDCGLPTSLLGWWGHWGRGALMNLAKCVFATLLKRQEIAL
jgi:hypothetical protein